MNCQGNMPSGPVGATLGGLTPQAAEIQEGHGHLNEGQLQTVQQHMQDGSPPSEVRGKDSSFIPKRFPCLWPFIGLKAIG